MKLKMNLRFVFLMTFLLSLGLFVSSIGVTWCRYQVTKKEDITFNVRSTGNFTIETNTNEWIFDESKQVYYINLDITNILQTENEVPSCRVNRGTLC